RRAPPGVWPRGPAERAQCARTAARRRRRRRRRLSGRRGRRLQGALAARRRQERRRRRGPPGRDAQGPRLGQRRPVGELGLGQLAGQRQPGRAAHALAGLGLLHALLGPAFFRSQVPQTKEEEPQQRGQAAPHGLHSGAAAAAQGRVPDQQVPDRAAAPEPGAGAQPQRVADQDLVPEQAGQDQEGHRQQEHAGRAPHGPGPVQPLHDRQGGQVGQRVGRAGAGAGLRRR
ncbi:unnamed protein product, partial [Gulo gulo]